MRSIVALALLLAVSATPVRAQSVPPPPATAILVPYRAGRMWGFANVAGGMVVGTAYRDVDLAVVHLGRLARVALETPEGMKWGAVAADGREALAPIYDEVRIRRDGVVFVRIGHKKGAAAPSGRDSSPSTSAGSAGTSAATAFR